MTLHFTTLLAIFGMALATYATRVAGLFLMRHVAVKGRVKAAFLRLPMIATIVIGVVSVVLLRTVV